MTSEKKAIIITDNAAKGEQLAGDIRSVTGAINIVQEHENAYGTIRETRPDAVFYFLTQDTQKDMDLIRRVTRHLPEIRVFILADKKDPEIILEGLRAKVTDYLLFPSPDGTLVKSVRDAMGHADGRDGEVIAVFSLKGGQGNSTICINLADHIQTLTGDKVLLADLNLVRGDIGPGLDIESSYTGFDLIRDNDRMDKNLFFSSLHHHARKFYVLPTPEEINDADQVSAGDMDRMLSIMKQSTDYTIIDMPHDLSERSLAALDAADRILLVARPSLPVMKNIQRILDLFQNLNYSEEKVRIILSCYSDKGDFTAKDLATVFDQPVFATITEDTSAVEQSENQARPLGMIKDSRRINKDFSKLAAMLTGINADNRGKTGLRGLIGNLFGM